MNRKIIFAAMLAALFVQGCALKFALEKKPDISGLTAALDVKCVKQQNDAMCGPASAQMVADYYGLTLNSSVLAELGGEAKNAWGITAASMKELFTSSGFDAAVFPGKLDGSFQGLYRNLDKKRPIIILLSPVKGAIGHYVVVCGYNAQKKLIEIMDPVKCLNIMDNDDMVREWGNSGNLTILALPQ